jgi:hypothetical protein
LNEGLQQLSVILQHPSMQRIILELKTGDDNESFLQLSFFRKDYKSSVNRIPLKELNYSMMDYLSILLANMLSGQEKLEEEIENKEPIDEFTKKKEGL